MSVSLDEHKLGGLRWIVLNGPDREAFGALGEHVRGELAGLTEAWPALPRLRERSVIAHNEDGFAGTSAARGETLDALGVPAADPDPSWFLGVLTSPPPGGVRSDPGPGGRGLTTLCTLVADLTAGKAVLAARGEQPVAIPLADLAEGHPQALRPLPPARF
jgi:hypothetical protein